MFTPKLEILPHAQRRLWDELRQTPEEFVLYRGTALALRLGHRHSEDFDFFSNNTFAPDLLRKRVPYLLDTIQLKPAEEGDLHGPVPMSDDGQGVGLRLADFGVDPDVTPDNRIQVASLLDVAATKLATIQQRAQARDYEDLAAIVGTGSSLAEALGAAAA